MKYLLLIPVLVLSGCSFNQYLDNLHSLNNEYIEQINDKKLISMGYDICYDLDNGVDLGKMIRESEIPIRTGLIANEAIQNFCPEHTKQLEELAEG